MPNILLTGHQPDAEPLFLAQDNTTVTVSAGSVFGNANSDFEISGRGVSNTTVNIFGTVAGGSWATVDLFDEVGSTILIGSAGRILDAPVMGIEVSFDSNIYNAGEIRSTRGFGIVSITPRAGGIVNDGLIFGEVGGVEFTGGNHEENTFARLLNRGSIRAGYGEDDQVFGASANEAVYSNAEATDIENSGTIASTDKSASGLTIEREGGGGFGGVGTALVINSGTISSEWQWGIDLARLGGASTVINSGSIVGTMGGLAGSAGKDFVTNTGDISGRVALGGGDDVFDSATGRVFGEIDGGAGNDRIVGGRTGDTLKGGDGNDTMDGSGGTDSFDGGAGRDTILYTSSSTAVRVDLAAGQVSFPGKAWTAESVTNIEDAETGSGNDLFIGSAAANRFVGNGGNDTFDGGGGTDSFDGGAGVDTVIYRSNTTPVRIDLAAGIASFPSMNWTPESFSSVENATGGAGADILIGSTGANVLRGLAGSDTMIGGGAADICIGGAGNDVFRFVRVIDSSPALRDTIRAGDGAIAFQGAGSAAGDRFDFSEIDANMTMGGNQAFVFGGTGAGHMNLTNSGTNTIIRCNTDNDATYELEIIIEDAGVAARQYTSVDFIL